MDDPPPFPTSTPSDLRECVDAADRRGVGVQEGPRRRGCRDEDIDDVRTPSPVWLQTSRTPTKKDVVRALSSPAYLAQEVGLPEKHSTHS